MNPQPADYKSAALPIELRQQQSTSGDCRRRCPQGIISGASERNRTTDTGIFSPLLYQLSYRGIKMATRRGLEPLTSAVTGRHSNQLNYRAVPGDAYGIRTREAAVKGRCLNHLTNAPYPRCAADDPCRPSAAHSRTPLYGISPHLSINFIYGSTDKFSPVILAHLFRPLFVDKSST